MLNSVEMFRDYARYVLVVAHPDDEFYTANIMASLVAQGKQVHIVYLTSGDGAASSLAAVRENEASRSAEIIGIDAQNLHFLRISEKTLLDSAATALTALNDLLSTLAPDCVITHDFEAGHNHHDFTSFCAYTVARRHNSDIWAFPAYHGLPEQRKWNQFIAGRQADFTFEFQPSDLMRKHKVFAAHQSQAKFFERILSSSSRPELESREVLRLLGTIDYSVSPTEPVGYEFPGSPASFARFVAAISAASQNNLVAG